MAISSTSNQIDLVKRRLENLEENEVEQLQNVYHYRLILGGLRSTGWTNIFLGGFTLWLGISGARYDSLHVFQAIIGALTLAISLWAVIRPSMLGVRAFAGIFLVAAVWNLFLTFRDSEYGISILSGLLGFAQLWWTYQYNQLYKKHRFLSKPSAALSQTYDEIVQAIHRTKPQTDPDFVELKFKQNRWHGWLLGNMAILSPKKQKLALLTREDNVTWTPLLANVDTKKRFIIHMRLDEISARGVISRGSFDKYALWKRANNPGQSPEELQLIGTGKHSWLPFAYLHPIMRIPMLIAGLIALLMVALTVFAFFLALTYS